ncbi:hypothetical protein [Streptomyces tritici]|uniref:hypothetical protein n=1 Tax=Streptomyces tritici TaxID=2054410 RepID=UPI003AF0D1A0
MRWPAGLGRGLAGPRRGRHAVPVDRLGLLALPLGDDGVVIGVDPDGGPAVLGLNSPAPYAVTLVGGLWTAQVLALRAAGAGTRVVVETGRAAEWEAPARAAGDEDGTPRVTVHGVGRVPPPGASADRPVLVVRDCGTRPPRGRIAAAPWQAVLTLLPHVSPVAPGLMRTSELVGVQRVSPDEAEQIGWIMGLPPTETDALPTLADGVTLWCTPRDRRLAMTRPTDAESGLLGAARRMD